MEVEAGEMTYGHMINHESSSQHNHIVPSSAVPNTITVPPPPPPPPPMEDRNIIITTNNRMIVRYRECLKNHAASIGGNATDGCGEFMPSGEEASLTCSACNCHRNFHRKEVQGEAHHQHSYHSAPSPLSRFGLGNVILQGRGMLGTESFGYNTQNNFNNNNNNAGVFVPSRPMIMSYNMGLGSLQTESDDQEDAGGFLSRHPHPQAHQIVKKRFRTKFTQEQKEKMLNFAEKVGWKIPKQEESVVQQLCQELGIKRRVLKVWMHNNKHNLAKNINAHVPTNPLNQIN